MNQVTGCQRRSVRTVPLPLDRRAEDIFQRQLIAALLDQAPRNPPQIQINHAPRFRVVLPAFQHDSREVFQRGRLADSVFPEQSKVRSRVVVVRPVAEKIDRDHLLTTLAFRRAITQRSRLCSIRFVMTDFRINGLLAEQVVHIFVMVGLNVSFFRLYGRSGCIGGRQVCGFKPEVPLLHGFAKSAFDPLRELGGEVGVVGPLQVLVEPGVAVLLSLMKKYLPLDQTFRIGRLKVKP